MAKYKLKRKYSRVEAMAIPKKSDSKAWEAFDKFAAKFKGWNKNSTGDGGFLVTQTSQREGKAGDYLVRNSTGRVDVLPADLFNDRYEENE